MSEPPKSEFATWVILVAGIIVVAALLVIKP